MSSLLAEKRNADDSARGEERLPPSRPRLFVSLLALIGAFALVAGSVAVGATGDFDDRALLWVEERFPEALDGLFLFFTTIGYYRVAGALALVCGALFLWRGLRLSAAVIVVSTLGGMAATTGFKYLFARPRPDFIDSGYMAGYFAFPSGHATVAVGFYGVLAALLFLRLPGPGRWFVLALGVVVAALIGTSRLYLGVHYPSDVIAGYLVSPTLITLFLLLYATFTRERSRKPR